MFNVEVDGQSSSEANSPIAVAFAAGDKWD